MKISYLSSAAAVLALALTQTSGAGTLTLNNITAGGTVSSVSIDSAGNVTVTGSGGGGGVTTAPAGCSLGASNLTPAANGSSVLTVSCASGSPPTSYTWTSSGGGPVIPVNSGNPYTVNFPNSGGPFTYSATASNSAGGPIATNSVDITVSPAGSGGGGDPTCPAPPTGLAVTETAQNLGTKKTYTYGANKAYAVRFTAGNNSFGSVGWIMPSGVPLISQLVSISRCPGDFTKTFPCGSFGTQNTLWSTSGAPVSYACPLTVGQTYYVNVRNNVTSTGADSCPQGKTCGVTLELK